MRLKKQAAAVFAVLSALVGLFIAGKYSLSSSAFAPASAQTTAPDTGDGTSAIPTGWKKASPAVVKAVTASITAQLKAFKSDDYQHASLYQSSALKQNFSSINSFRAMMKASYPEFASYKSVTYGPIFSTTDKLTVQVPVKLVGTDGVTVDAVYLMVLENGLYRVAGVTGGEKIVPIQMPQDPAIS